MFYLFQWKISAESHTYPSCTRFLNLSRVQPFSCLSQRNPDQCSPPENRVDGICIPRFGLCNLRNATESIYKRSSKTSKGLRFLNKFPQCSGFPEQLRNNVHKIKKYMNFHHFSWISSSCAQGWEHQHSRCFLHSLCLSVGRSHILWRRWKSMLSLLCFAASEPHSDS